jgi:hypothetical protein
LKDNLTHLSQRFAYQHQLSNVKTDHTIIPAIPAIIADATLGIMAAPAVPASFMYTNEINILEVYSDKLIKIYTINDLKAVGVGVVVGVGMYHK